MKIFPVSQMKDLRSKVASGKRGTWLMILMLSLMAIFSGCVIHPHFEPVGYGGPQQQEGEMVFLQAYYIAGGKYGIHYVRHRNFLGEVSNPPDGMRDGTRSFDDFVFRMGPGLAGRNTVSFESKNFPGYYLRHQNFRIKLHRMDGSELFRKDASFLVVPGLGNPSWNSLESYNFPGYFLRHQNFHLYIARGSTDLFRKDATFRILRGVEKELEMMDRIGR